MRSSRHLAVDVGAAHVACGVFTAGAAGRLVLQQFALEPHSSDPSHETRWAIEIAHSLGALAARHKLAGAASIAVPGHLALTKFIKTPSMAKDRRANIIAFEAAENIPYPLEEVVWDHLVVADDSFDLEIMLTAVKFDAMQSLCVAADSAGFPVERAMPAGLALCHAFRYNYPEIRDSVIVVNIGARSTNLLFLEGERFYIRTLAVAGNAVTQAVAEELRIDFPQAETLKVQVLSGHSDLPANSHSRAAVQRAAGAFCARIQLEIIRSTVNHRRNSGGLAPTAVYVTGGGSLIAGLPAAIAEKLKLPVQRYEPLRNVDLSADARAAGVEASAQALADLVGLATRLVVRNEPEASLLPPAITEAIAFRKRQPRLLVAAALVLAALLPPIVYFHHVTTATLAKVAQVDSQLMPLRALQSRNDDNLRQIEEAKKQITALRGAYETKANWINFFTDLQARLVEVENVWLDRLHVVRAPLPEPGAVPEVPPPADAASAGAPAAAAPVAAAPFKLTLAGRLLDVDNPQSKVSPQSFERVKQLLQKFKQSQFVSSVENERFDNTQNGLLRFDFTLVINPKKPL
ncbi:MAG: pilus assembly protein PilM [Verrucomicrobia bacterium]|nr:pilus assembly protein PilM [Verrucomicrobiota bacterium]